MRRMRTSAPVIVLLLAAIMVIQAPLASAAPVRFDRRVRDGFLALGQAGWRAGSGVSTDACQRNAGWLPTGHYDVRTFVHNKDDVIKGRAWWLSDKACASYPYTMRTELFIHTEETSTTDQYCPTSGDDPYCWDTDYGDYASEGCIKIKQPNMDMYQFHHEWHRLVSGAHGTVNYNDAVWVNGL
jgi:hypothetical protein